MIDQFAMRGLLPSRISMELVDDAISMRVEQADIDPALAELIAEKLRSSVLIRSVGLDTASETHGVCRGTDGR